MSTDRRKRIRSRYCTELCALALLAVVCGPAGAASDLGQLIRSNGLSSPRDYSLGAPSSYYLNAVVNGADTSFIVTCQHRGNGWWILPSHLAVLGVRVDDLRPDAAGWVDLDAISGLSHRYDGASQRLELTVLSSRRNLHVVRNTPDVRRGDSRVGALFNYDAVVEEQRGATALRAFSEQRLFGGWGVVSHGGIYSAARGDSDYVRLNTAWTHADPGTVRSITAGDFISRSLTSSRSVRLAGVQIRRNFALSPDLVTYPVTEFAGEAAVPSTVEVYINQVRQLTSDVPAGPFRIEAPPSVNGAGQATVVVRNALGRDTVQTLDLYVVPQLLAEGLSDYSFEAGVLRENFGLNSSDYRSGPVGSGTYRYGARDWITLESHAEAGDELYQIGTGALFKLGRFGQMNVSYNLSKAEATGRKFGVGYQYVSRRLSVSADLQQADSRYRDLASLLGDLPPRRQARLFLGAQLSPGMHLSASYLVADVMGNTRPFGEPPDSEVVSATASRSRLVSAGFRQQLGRRISVSVSAFRDLERERSGGIYLGFSAVIGQATQLQTDYSSADEQSGVSLARRSPYEGGWDWNLRGNRSDSTRYQAGTRYTGDKGALSLDVAGEAGEQRWQLGMRGALVSAGATLLAGRYVQDEFAVISTNGLGGVPVLHENRPAGRTNDKGYLLLSNVNAYQVNRIAVDPLSIPFGFRIDRHERSATPRLSAGALVTFAIDDPRSASLTLLDADGEPLPAGSRGQLAGSDIGFVIGYGGSAYLTDLGDAALLRVETAHGVCEARIRRAGNRRPQADLGRVVCR